MRVLALLLALGCGNERPKPIAPPVAVAPPVTVAPPVALASPVAVAARTPERCDGPNQRMFGSSCCESTNKRHRTPGATTLRCRGPQIGLPCRKSTDCDIMCSCDGDDPPDPRSGSTGPADGTRGVVGTCSGELEAGVWMCELDDKGVVTHLIID